jgi:serine protease Do
MQSVHRGRCPCGVVMLTAVVASGLLVDPAGAQGTPVGSRTRPAAGGGNVCKELESSPSPLVHAPEGLALLRLRRQLESAAFTLEQQQQLERDQLQRIALVRRGMDSLMQVVVRSQEEPGVRVEERTASFRGVQDGRRMIVTIDSGNGPVTVNIEQMMRGMVPLVGRALDSTLVVMAPQVERIIRTLQPQVAAFAGAAEAALPGGVTAPSGYMGLSLSGAQIRIVTPGGVMTSHCEYPLVETVDVGSPAARAGLSAGDTLVAYNGRDVKQTAVNYAELIAAGNTVRVSVRRAGKHREVPVQVDPRRDDPSSVPVRIMLRGRPERSSPVPPPSPAMFNPSGVAVLAGAQFATMDAEFAQSVGLDAGVLVLRVPVGTPAADAGLKSGDVVRSVNGVAVRDVAALRRALSTSREAKLVVQARGGAARTVIIEGR